MGASSIVEMSEDVVFAEIEKALAVHNQLAGELIESMRIAEELRRTTYGCWVEVSREEFWYIKGASQMWWDDEIGRYRDWRGRFLPSRYAYMKHIFARAGVRCDDNSPSPHVLSIGRFTPYTLMVEDVG